MLAFAANAQAADLPAMPAKAPAPAYVPSYNWNGFYVGGNVGWGWAPHTSDAFTDAGAFVSSASNTRDGLLGGLQAGFNWMAWPSILIGIEADIDAADIKYTNVSTTGTGTSSTESKDDWFGTVRGRLGYAMNNWLFYGTGGFAWMHDKATRTVLASVVPALVGQSASVSATLTGWTAGGGVEVGLTPNWTARLEYLHMDFGSYTSHFVYVPAVGNRMNNETLRADIVRFGINYKFN
jgi:outer membrane immunogenic protein